MLRVLWEDAIPIEELEKRDDRYWLEECKKVAQNSRCLSRKIGAIIVDPFGWKISEGFNVISSPSETFLTLSGLLPIFPQN